jgi:hypothetical protein
MVPDGGNFHKLGRTQTNFVMIVGDFVGMVVSGPVVGSSNSNHNFGRFRRFGNPLKRSITNLESCTLLLHVFRILVEIAQIKAIDRDVPPAGEKECKACNSSNHGHTTCNLGIIEANYRFHFARRSNTHVDKMVLSMGHVGTWKHATTRMIAHSNDVEKEFSTMAGVGNGHWPKSARDSIEISRHSNPLTSSSGQNIVLVVSYLRYD